MTDQRPRPAEPPAESPEAEEAALLDDRLWRRVINALVATAVAVLALAALLVSREALDTLDEVLVPEFNREAELVARVVATELERAADLGIPVDRLRGVEPFLEDHLVRSTAAVYLAVAAPDGRVLYGAGDGLAALEAAPPPGGPPMEGEARTVRTFGALRDESFPLRKDGQVFARLHVGIDRAYAERQIADIRWDVIVVLVVSLLITFELLVFVVDRNILTPMRLIRRTLEEAAGGDWTIRPRRRGGGGEVGRVTAALDGVSQRIHRAFGRIDLKLARMGAIPEAIALRLGALRRTVRVRFAEEGWSAVPSRVDARLPLFLFVLAEELSRSFLPIYAEALYVPLGSVVPALAGQSLPPQTVVALPIVVFMGFVALATPYGGAIVARHGARRVFLAGAALAVIGYLGTAGAATVYDLLLWRALSAIGYGIVTIAAQGYLAATAAPGERARAMAVFVAAVTTAVICGSSIGALIADRLGFRATFLISAVLVALSASLAAAYLAAPRRTGADASAPLSQVMRAFLNPRFAALVVLIAIPAKIALTGFLFYLTPLFLAERDVSQPAIGRIVMLYGIFMLVGIRLGATLGDRRGLSLPLLTLGGLATGGALALVPGLDPVPAMTVAIAIFGFAQGIASAPMLAVVPVLCPAEAVSYGATSLVALLRLAERVGSVIGPLIAATIIAAAGYNATIVAIGAVSAATALVFHFLALRFRAADREARQEAAHGGTDRDAA